MEVMAFEIPTIEISVIPNTPLGTATPQSGEPQQLKKKESTSVDMTKDDERAWLEHLSTKGEYMDPEEWELIDEREAGSHEEALKDEEMFRGVALGLEQYDNSDTKSNWGDTGLYKLRYAYSQNLSDNSRDFCIEMVGLSRKKIVFRYEDIKAMGDAGENGQFAPEGQSTYDIFVWKGGCFCHHKWMRQIYFRKRKGGKFMPNDGLKNDKRVANVPFVPQKGPEGIAPIDTPSRGSLKYS
jgi:hypothetical protein